MRYRKGGDQVNYSYLTLCVLSLRTIWWVYKLVWRKLLNAVVSLVSSLIAILKVFKRLVTTLLNGLLNEWRWQCFLKDRPMFISSASFFFVCQGRVCVLFWKIMKSEKKRSWFLLRDLLGSHWLLLVNLRIVNISVSVCKLFNIKISSEPVFLFIHWTQLC